MPSHSSEASFNSLAMSKSWLPNSTDFFICGFLFFLINQNCSPGQSAWTIAWQQDLRISSPLHLLPTQSNLNCASEILFPTEVVVLSILWPQQSSSAPPKFSLSDTMELKHRQSFKNLQPGILCNVVNCTHALTLCILCSFIDICGEKFSYIAGGLNRKPV